MKADILDLNGSKNRKIDLPNQFNEGYRPEIIKRAVLVLQANRRQKQGADPRAGKRYSAKLSRRRREYRGAYNHGISRVPRKIMTRRGRNFFWVGAWAPGTVGGRKAHPPKLTKDYTKKINIKEKKLAIRSAISATLDKVLVNKRGHLINEVPFVIESKFEDMNQTIKVEEFLKKIGLEKELERTKIRKVRAGRGKSHGRKYRKKKGPLIIIAGDCKLKKSAKNIAGVEIVHVNRLNAELLAPGTEAGRLCIWSEKAIEKMQKENLFFVKEKKNG